MSVESMPVGGEGDPRIERLRADGCESFEHLYRESLVAHERGKALAIIEEQHARLGELGLYLEPPRILCERFLGEKREPGNRTGQAVGVHGFRDGRGNILSAELHFVSVASAIYGATDLEMAEAMFPRETKGDARPRAVKRVEKMRRRLHELRIMVRFDCGGCEAHPDRYPKSQS